jgi:hypothetical protein
MVPQDATVAAVSDLCTLSCYFLLRVREYTVSSPWKIHQTAQFRVLDVTFWKDGSIIPNMAGIYKRGHCSFSPTKVTGPFLPPLKITPKNNKKLDIGLSL